MTLVASEVKTKLAAKPFSVTISTTTGGTGSNHLGTKVQLSRSVNPSLNPSLNPSVNPYSML